MDSETKLKYMEIVRTGDSMSVTDALEELCRKPTADDFDFLVEAYDRRRWMVDRTEIVDGIGRIGGPKTSKFLRAVVSSRGHYLVRYYAARNLIELGDDSLSLNLRQPKNEFWQSLASYASFVRGNQSLDSLREIARSKTKQPGDHWAWITELSDNYVRVLSAIHPE